MVNSRAASRKARLKPRQAFSRCRRLGLSLAIALLSACRPALLARVPRPAAGSPAPSAGSAAELRDYLSAREGLALAIQALDALAPQAFLIRVEGQWVDAGGRSRSWSYHFYDAAKALRLVIEGGKLQLSRPEASEPQPLADWPLDSDALLSQLELSAGPVYPLTLMRLESGGIWRIESPDSRWRVDARTGLLLPD